MTDEFDYTKFTDGRQSPNQADPGNPPPAVVYHPEVKNELSVQDRFDQIYYKKTSEEQLDSSINTGLKILLIPLGTLSLLFLIVMGVCAR